MNRRALGLIEVKGYLGAIEAADIALKSANVNLIGCEIVRGGLVTVKLEGDVSSVKAAVEAAEDALTKSNILVVAHVIARPDTSVWDIIENNVDQEEKIQKIEKIEHKDNTKDNSASLREDLESKKVNDLRTLARSFNLDSMTKKQIKFAKKDRLVDEIILFYQRRTK
ncbi:BMC domain-containing protein [Clostridium bowmanii]|uniref:BMC domain-containing protein n=1 Tax=Clostridium bowmanii TaxID=132925 RepID=UPI001C0C187A|nr:BMC domain-containing protein [Clostridium bowmanii]MBU3190819.1 BMC domain-containing protein [Clostridium bowmanii]